MPIITIIIVLIVVGVALWAINNFIPMPSSIKTIINIIVVIALCLWLLQVFGVIDDIGGMRIE